MPIEMENLDVIKIRKDGGELILLRFDESNSVADIDYAIRQALSLGDSVKYSVSYKDHGADQDVLIVANGKMLHKLREESINQFDVFVDPQSSPRRPYFETTIPPWIVRMDALQGALCNGLTQDPKPLPYLTQKEPNALNIDLEVTVKRKQRKTIRLFIFKPMLVHHSSTGCNL
ncbi:hypothetical protein I4U23_000380 [Adineta vaga]|nr:hypothetical protein I4U23_000380 [Adineta vaga]